MPEIRILILEDLTTDLEIVTDELRRAGLGFEYRHVTDEAGYRRELRQFQPDIILSDYNVPGFGGLEALAVRNRERPALPFIFVSGTLGEERAVETLRSGATDYVLKDRLTRLPSAVRRALEEARVAAAADAEHALNQAILETADALIVTLDEHENILHANPAAQRVAALDERDITGQSFRECFIVAEQADAFRVRMLADGESGRGTESAWQAMTPSRRTVVWSGSPLHSGQHPEARLVLCGIDITDQERAREQAYFLDHFDPLTQLPNRKLFSLQLRQFLDSASRVPSGDATVLSICLGRLSEIHDSYGDTVAHRLIHETVRRLKTWQIRHELLARTGEHCFTLAFTSMDQAELADAVPFILKELAAPVEIDNQHWVLPVHAGVAQYQQGRQSADELLMAAEAALHEAESRKESYVIYQARLAVRIRERLQLEGELHAALRHPEQFAVYYQPQFEAQSGRLVGLEALVRWRHPRLGLILPGRFIPLAETSGCMPGIGRIVLREVCRQIRQWQRSGLTVPTLAINVSATEFADPFLTDTLQESMREFAQDRDQLEVEITKSASMSNPEATITILTALRKMGVRIAIDDFGTGYSNLSYLKRFPIHRLKLDQAFVRDILLDRNDLAISQAVIAIAHQLQLDVVAEGVEDPGQLDVLQNAGCDQIQGYLFGTPRAGADCHEWLKRGAIEPASRHQPD